MLWFLGKTENVLKQLYLCKPLKMLRQLFPIDLVPFSTDKIFKTTVVLHVKGLEKCAICCIQFTTGYVGNL